MASDRKLALLLTFCGPALALLPAARADDERAATLGRIERFLAPYEEAGHLSGTLLVALDDDVLLERSFGLASVEPEEENTAETRHCVASVTKPMTVVVALRLLEAGEVAADDRLSKFLPDFPRGDEITLEHLLNHRAGIPHRVTDDETVRRTAADMAALAAKVPLLHDPGAGHGYSSAGFSVLARALEVASGRTFSELLREHVFEAADMTRSVDSIDLVDDDHARAYRWTPTGLVPSEEKDLSFLVGAGSVWSTARDLFRLQRAILSGRLGETVRANTVRNGGLAWNGVTGGFRAFADFHRRTGVTIVWVGNVQTGAADRMRKGLAWIVDGDEPEPADVPTCDPVAVADETLSRYTGAYELRPGSTLDVRPDGGRLRVNDWLLFPTSATTFFSPQDYGTVTVVLDEDGAPIRLDWENDGEVTPMPRVDG
ncbi:MAG: serine hydrolase [Planctomycetota bacterium JB042]